MKKWVIIGVVTFAIIITWTMWSCLVVASREDDRMEEMMRQQEGEDNGESQTIEHEKI